MVQGTRKKFGLDKNGVKEAQRDACGLSAWADQAVTHRCCAMPCCRALTRGFAPAGQRLTWPRSRSLASAKAAARDVVEVENPEGKAPANQPTVLGLTIPGDIAR